MPSHRANTSSDKDTRKSRVVRLGALLLAVVGVTAAATSAGFTNDAWFSAKASSASVSLQGRIAGDNSAEWKDADTNTDDVIIKVPEGTFANMVAGETRTVTVDLRNAGTTPLEISADWKGTGTLLEDSEKTTIDVSIDGSNSDGKTTLAAEHTTTAKITVTAAQWSEDMQSKALSDNTLTVGFTGTTVVGND